MTKKKIIRFFTILYVLLVGISCTNFHVEDVPDGISADTRELAFSSDANSRSLSIKSSAKWIVASKPEWISIQAINQSSSPFVWDVTVSATANDDFDREGSIIILQGNVFKEGNPSESISVTQEGKKGKFVAVESISISSTELLMTEGDQIQLLCTIYPSNASIKSVSWISNNPSVATVSSTGRVDAVSKGTTTVTVTTDDGNKVASCVVNVKQVSVSSVSLNKTSISLIIGESSHLIATVLPKTAANKKVSWSSSNASIASVDSEGKVTAVGVGSATITVRTDDGGKTATCIVTVNPISVTGVSLDKTSLSMTVGDTQTLTATITPSNATNKAVSWSSSNTSIATVSYSGVVTAEAAGSATITVTTSDGGKKATCAVTVLSTSGTENGHEWIDLGLSVKWSPYNYGASSNTDNGGYYFWGDPTGTASAYYYSVPQTYHISGTSYDIAKQQWGGHWRLPSFSEVKELYTKCSWSWTTLDGKIMLKATGPNGKSIYFVPTGLMYNDSYQTSDCVIILSGDSFNATSFASYVTIYPYFYRISPNGESTEAGHSGDNCRFPIRPVL